MEMELGNVIVPVVVIRPTRSAYSVNHSAPSGPAVIPSGSPPPEMGYSVKTPHTSELNFTAIGTCSVAPPLSAAGVTVAVKYTVEFGLGIDGRVSVKAFGDAAECDVTARCAGSPDDRVVTGAPGPRMKFASASTPRTLTN